MTYKELITNPKYRYHHTASRRGYTSRKAPPKIEEYNGRFGTGYIAICPRWDSSYYVYVEYYIQIKD